MRTARNIDSIDELLSKGKELSVADFKSVLPEMAMPSVYTRIKALCDSGRLSRMGRGKYLPVKKPAYHAMITPWMREVNEVLIDECVGVDHCLYEKDGNLYVEAARSELKTIETCLMYHYSKVVRERDAKRFPYLLVGYIVIGVLISDAPVFDESGILIPTMEKEIVDTLCDNKKEPEHILDKVQKKMEIYPINRNRLKRYAARRGVAEEMADCLSALDSSRMDMFTQVQNYLAGIPVTKAWVFGSFARGEETKESDLDLLVDYDPIAKVSLYDIIRFKLDLERIIHREVDLVENGYLKPFAIPSADKEKYLIYER